MILATMVPTAHHDEMEMKKYKAYWRVWSTRPSCPIDIPILKTNIDKWQMWISWIGRTKVNRWILKHPNKLNYVHQLMHRLTSYSLFWKQSMDNKNALYYEVCRGKVAQPRLLWFYLKTLKSIRHQASSCCLRKWKHVALKLLDLLTSFIGSS
jgi:hypothetical protein